MIPGNSYTISFDAKGEDQWNFRIHSLSGVPRLLSILAPFKTIEETRPLGILIDHEWRHYDLTFIAADCSNINESHFGCDPKTMNQNSISFGISEQRGKTWIRNIQLFKGSSERWSREYEHGMVLLNMSQNTWSNIPLKPLPNNCFYERLNGKVDPVVNDGFKILNNLAHVPSQDALFLHKICN